VRAAVHGTSKIFGVILRAARGAIDGTATTLSIVALAI
jgi:hypothetical protein